MTTYELVAVSIALGAISVPVITWLALWLIRRDRIFSNLPPGEIPVNPEEAPTRFVSRGAHYWGEVEARSTPPEGVSPGLAGVVVDGSADGRDIAAMILDLARRGWLQLQQVSGTETSGGDWAITRVDQPLDATLDLNEVHLITNIATPGGTSWVSELCAASDNRLALVQQDLHREVVSRGWYPAPPHETSDVPMAVLGVGGLLGCVIAIVDVSGVTIGAGAVIIACAYLTSLAVRGGTPRTALGTAVRIQTLGLRRYLEEAQSYQFSYTDALETFRTYLPWAVVFELEDTWAEVFSTLDVVAETSELHFARDLGWFANIHDRVRALPQTVPVGEATAPRRGAYSEQDVVSTVLMSADEVAAGKQTAVAKVTIVARTPGTSGGTPVPAGPPNPAGSYRAGVTAPGGSGIVPVLRRTASAVSGLWKRARTDETEDTHRIVPLTQGGADEVPPSETPAAAEPVPTLLAEAADVVDKVPSVRQWVPKESSRPAVLQARATPAAEASSVRSAPIAPVTPVRAPAGGEGAATPARAPKRQTVREPRSEATIFAHWMSELDLAMTGEVEDNDLEATDGGTVITGPERFDVLLTPPLWPDVPLGTTGASRHVR